MRGLAMALLVAAAGCGTMSPADEVAEVAETYCACALPGNKMCVTQFESFVTSVSDACSQCVFEHERRCASMQTDCTQLCLQSQTP